MPAKLFTKKAATELRSLRFAMRLNAAEDAAINHAAAIRQLPVADYVRRAALGRRADVRYETDIILKLTDLTRAIRAMHADFVQGGVAPTAEGFRAVIEDCRAAILRIEK